MHTSMCIYNGIYIYIYIYIYNIIYIIYVSYIKHFFWGEGCRLPHHPPPTNVGEGLPPTLHTPHWQILRGVTPQTLLRREHGLSLPTSHKAYHLPQVVTIKRFEGFGLELCLYPVTLIPWLGHVCKIGIAYTLTQGQCYHSTGVKENSSAVFLVFNGCSPEVRGCSRGNQPSATGVNQVQTSEVRSACHFQHFHTHIYIYIYI